MSLLASAGYSFAQVFSVVVLVLGFGFVIFFHELGHFMAAKWVGIKVEQFAVGFGQALFSWRKGIGFRVGNTQKEYQRRLEEHVAQKQKERRRIHGRMGNAHEAALVDVQKETGLGDTAYQKESERRQDQDATLDRDDVQLQDKTGDAYQQALLNAEKELGLGETEYRLNWIPLGGYVKMLGQDDLRPNSEATDPRSYNRKSIPARMIVVSAGVIMNIILAGIGFMVLFLIGFHVPPAWVGAVVSGSPAQSTVTVDGKPKPLVVGDKILEFEGRPQEDFTKIGLNVALAPDNVPVPIKVQHVDGSVEELRISPRQDPGTGFLSIGIAAPHLLQGIDPKDVDPELLKKSEELSTRDVMAVQPGETITQINGKSIDYHDYWKLSEAMQNPDAAPVQLTVRNDATGQVRQTTIHPHFEPGYGGGQIDIAGMLFRPAILGIQPDSPARGKIQPGDVVLSISKGVDTRTNPTSEQFRKMLKEAGEGGQPVSIVVLRDGKEVSIPNLSVTAKIENGKGQRGKGLGVGLGYDETHPVVAGKTDGGPADNAGIPLGATLTSVNGKKVSTWFDVQRYLGEAKAGVPIPIEFTTAGGPARKDMILGEDQLAHVRGLQRGDDDLLLRDYVIIRQARTAGGRLDPLKAASWGVSETRDFILQFYLTLRRMAGGSVSPDQLMGPVGIFVGGARFAFKGADWLLWFLAMISANLAVVNFLPIPIVDGGLFTFLILEKIQGRPLSPRAQAIAQYVGLAFLAGVFLFVTYHDILRYIPFG
jgi:regulator of sigma E protease